MREPVQVEDSAGVCRGCMYARSGDTCTDDPCFDSGTDWIWVDDLPPTEADAKRERLQKVVDLVREQGRKGGAA